MKLIKAFPFAIREVQTDNGTEWTTALLVKDPTNKTLFEEWKENYIYLTELVLVLNWKIWQHYDKNNKLAEIYDELWMKADMYACENLHGDELTYFFDIID